MIVKNHASQRHLRWTPQQPQGLVYDINASHVFGLRESKPKAMHAQGRSSGTIAQGLVSAINAPHVSGLRELKPKGMHAYRSSSAPITQGLVHGINAPHVFGLRESKRNCGPVSIPTAQGLLVAIMHTKAKYIVTVQKAQGLVGNTHHDEKHMLTNYTLDRMSGAKAVKQSNSGATPKKITSLDETNHAAVSLTPTEDDSTRWVSTFAPLTLLKAASKHAAMIIIDKGPNKG